MTRPVTKKCLKCYKVDVIDKFRKKSNVCKTCVSEQMKKWRANNKDKIKIKNKKWRQTNRDRYLEGMKVWKNTTAGYFCLKANRLKIRKDKVDVPITPEFLRNLYNKQNGKCVLTDRKLLIKIGVNACMLDTLSVDRINNKKGYSPENIRLVTVQANSARMTGSDQQLLEFCKDVIKRSRSCLGR